MLLFISRMRVQKPKLEVVNVEAVVETTQTSEAEELTPLPSSNVSSVGL